MPSLDIDALSHILAFIDSSEDISRAARSCRTLYFVGVSTLLKGGVTIHHSRHFSSFLSFIRRDAEYRVPLVRRLNILARLDDHVETDPKTFCDTLMRILRQCRSIRTLHVEHTTLLVRHGHRHRCPQIVTILSALDQLQELRLAALGFVAAEDIHTVLGSVSSSQLDNLDLDFPCGLPPPQWERYKYDSICGFPPSISSVRTLRLADASLRLTSVQLANVATLVLTSYHDSLAQLLRLSLNVRRLILDGISCGDASDSIDVMRQQNRAAFIAADPKWEGLDYLRGTPSDVYTLGLSCAVRRWDVPSSSAPADVENLLDATEGIQVTRLVIPFNGVRVASKFFRLASQSFHCHPTHLAIDVNVFGPYMAPEVAIEAFLVSSLLPQRPQEH